MSHRNRRITIVYRCKEFVTWISSIVAWNLLRGYRLLSHGICRMDIVYRHIEFVTWILSIVTLLLSVVTLLLSIVASMLSHVHHRIARPLGPPYVVGTVYRGVSNE